MDVFSFLIFCLMYASLLVGVLAGLLIGALFGLHDKTGGREA